jgi:[protein-PII] uridylyltransferase
MRQGELLALSAESNEFRAVTEVVVYTPDHPGLFSQLSGAVAVSGGSIVDAKAFTTTDGFALDIFSVQDAEGGPFGDPARVARLRRTIAKTLSGEISPARSSPSVRPASGRERSRFGRGSISTMRLRRSPPSWKWKAPTGPAFSTT